LEVTCHIDDMVEISRPSAVPALVPGAAAGPAGKQPPAETVPPREIGGPKGPEPTRYGDWEVNGRCSDF